MIFFLFPREKWPQPDHLYYSVLCSLNHLPYLEIYIARENMREITCTLNPISCCPVAMAYVRLM